MPKSLCFEKGGLDSCISRFVHPSLPIREKYSNCPNTHKLYTLLLIAEAKNKISRNSGISNVNTFCMLISKVLSFTPHGGTFVLQSRK